MRQWWTVPGPTGGRLELREVDEPAPGRGELLVRVAGAGVNRGELIARPALKSDNPKAKAYPSGAEFAGTIAAVGEGVTGRAVGDRVMGRGQACYADFTVVAAEAAMSVPSHLSDVQAAAIPNVFVTAHDAVVTNAEVKPGETVLITAGSSGVGTAAIQIARHLGAGSVAVTTRSPAKEASLRELGATDVINTNGQDWAEVITQSCGPVDVVIDQVGGSIFSDVLSTMGLGGRFIGVGRNGGAMGKIDLDYLARKRLRLIGVTFRTRTPAETLACSERFAEDLLECFDDDRLRPVLDRTFPLEELADAHHYMLGNTQLGKIVMVP
ncbi:MAG: zinc-binding dehydrogenase [Acidimicrobiales bacterium]